MLWACWHLSLGSMMTAQHSTVVVGIGRKLKPSTMVPVQPDSLQTGFPAKRLQNAFEQLGEDARVHATASFEPPLVHSGTAARGKVALLSRLRCSSNFTKAVNTSAGQRHNDSM